MRMSQLAYLAVSFIAVTQALAQTWTPTTAPTNGWTAIASSADGTKLFAVSAPVFVDYVYVLSTNAGATWTTNVEPQQGSDYNPWSCIASSADGAKLVALNTDTVWASTNSGASWVSNTVPGVIFWSCVASSADGTKLVAGDGGGCCGPGGLIYTSTNSGISWLATTAPSNNWRSIASSADGTVLAAAVAANNPPPIPVYVSTNSGATWNLTSSPTNMMCYGIACSADGSRLVVVGIAADWSTSMVYTSTNTGCTWVSNNVLPAASKIWYGVASSADGTRLIAISQGHASIATSTNAGTTWTSNSTPNNISWLSVASPADGGQLWSTCLDSTIHGGIYSSQSTRSPQLNAALERNGDLVISWIIPSTSLVLQQSSDLSIWSTVTNMPLLNLTNLQNQVTLPLPAGNNFYRLKTP